MSKRCFFCVVPIFVLGLLCTSPANAQADPNPVPSGTASSFNLLAYNIQMLPEYLAAAGQADRAPLLPPKLRGYDAIIFSEAFDNSIRQHQLLPALKSEYPFQTQVVGLDAPTAENDGGVVIVSRHPIPLVASGRHVPERLFGDACNGHLDPLTIVGLTDDYGADCNAAKGVLYAKIVKDGRNYHVFGTHLDSGEDAGDRDARLKQFRIVRDFIDSIGIPASEPVLIGGDLNVRMQNPDEYATMLRVLNATHPRLEGSLVTSRRSSLLDYVLYSNAHLRPFNSYNQVRRIRSDRPWKDGVSDLSDHHAVFGRFDFFDFVNLVPLALVPTSAQTIIGTLVPTIAIPLP
jgi:endonuclease/exonuclease/phosphatase family metal-dependent hydrolase